MLWDRTRAKWFVSRASGVGLDLLLGVHVGSAIDCGDIPETASDDTEFLEY